MKARKRVLLALLIIIIAELVVLSSFRYVSSSGNTSYTYTTEGGSFQTVILVGKMDFVCARVYIAAPYASWAEIMLPDGSTFNMTGNTTFTTFLPGSISPSIPAEFQVTGTDDKPLTISDSQPIVIDMGNTPPYSTEYPGYGISFYEFTVITPYLTQMDVQVFGVVT